MTINRTALAAQIAMQPIPAILAAPLTVAIYTCGEPVDFNTKPYLDCVRKACMSSVQVPPFINAGIPGIPPAVLPPAVSDFTTGLLNSAVSSSNPAPPPAGASALPSGAAATPVGGYPGLPSDSNTMANWLASIGSGMAGTGVAAGAAGAAAVPGLVL